MQTNRDKRIHVLVDITPTEKSKARALAKSKGMTLQGFVGQLIRKELEISDNSEAVNG